MEIKIIINISEDLVKQVLAEDSDGSEKIKQISIDLKKEKSNISEVNYSYYRDNIFSDEEYCDIYGIDDGVI